MAYAKRSLTYFIVHTFIGIIALIFALFGNLPDDYRNGIVSGIAGGFIVTGLIGIIKSIRLIKTPQKAAQMEIFKNEERIQLIRMKTHSAIYSVIIYIECIGTLVAGISGFKEISIVLAALLLIKAILFIGFTYYYNNKY